MNYFFCWITSFYGARMYEFGYSKKPAGHVLMNDVDFLEDWEVGQELGGN